MIYYSNHSLLSGRLTILFFKNWINNFIRPCIYVSLYHTTLVVSKIVRKNIFLHIFNNITRVKKNHPGWV